MQDRLLALFLSLGTNWVLVVLLVLSVVSVAVMAGRAFDLWRHRTRADQTAALLHAALRSADGAQAQRVLADASGYAAGIAQAGLRAMQTGPVSPASIEETIGAATLSARLRMERGLAFLGTLGNNAPFVGLFGTVLGIIRAFDDLAKSAGAPGAAGAQAVIAGVAEALVATAVGLLVALPAVAAFNTLSRWVRIELNAAGQLTHVLMAHARRPESAPQG